MNKKRKIRWVTIKEVENAAKRGRKAALLCSIKHWRQNVEATAEEIEKAPLGSLSGNLCALCHKYDESNCIGCPLAEYTGKTCNNSGSLYWQAWIAWSRYDSKQAAYTWWIKASERVLKALEGAYASLYGKAPVVKKPGKSRNSKRKKRGK